MSHHTVSNVADEEQVFSPLRRHCRWHRAVAPSRRFPPWRPPSHPLFGLGGQSAALVAAEAAPRRMSGRAKGATAGTVTSEDLNYLIYRYLQESGFNHSAFTFGYESFINKSNINGASVPPGALVAFLQKGLQYCEVEAQVASDGPDEIEPPTTLLQAASDMVSGARRKAKSKRQRTKGPAAPEQSLDVAAQDVTVLSGHAKEVFVCSWNPGHALLASGSGDSSARIWNLESGVSDAKRSVVLDHDLGGSDAKPADGSSKDITTLDWNADGSKLATGCYDGLGRVWSKEGKLLKTLEAHQGPIFSLKWNRRSDMLLSGSVDKTAIIWCALPTSQTAFPPASRPDRQATLAGMRRRAK